MNQQRILEELLALLEAKNIEIRREPLGGSGGGLCTVRGKHMFFVDTQAAATEMAASCAEAVARVVDVENIYLRPEVREFVESHTHPAT
jgi:hypothetical protein